MSEPTILFVKPKAISARDKKALQGAGVIVVEVEDPQAVKLVRAGYELPNGGLLVAAMQAMQNSGSILTWQRFGEAVGTAILANYAPKPDARSHE